MAQKKIKVVVVGSGVVGSLICQGLKEDPRFELICLERTARDEYSGSGTGLNVGPNAIKTLNAFFPEIGQSVVNASLPWDKWQVSLVDGTVLMDVLVRDFAENAGIRIRWAELYRQLRLPVIDYIRFNLTVNRMEYQGDHLSITYQDNQTGEEASIDEIDLLIGADGRFSEVRNYFFKPEPPRMAGMGICRLLATPEDSKFPIDDYGQWFNGPNRLLGFRLPGDAFYATATFPIKPEEQIPELFKTSEHIRERFTPDYGSLCPEAAFILDCIEKQKHDLHWARFAESDFHWEDARKQVLLLGDASHAMLPTLGQGATLAIEDACAAGDSLLLHADPSNPVESIKSALEHYRKRREVRVHFAAQLTQEGSDTLMPGTDVINDTIRKTRRPFTDNLVKLYCDTPARLSQE